MRSAIDRQAQSSVDDGVAKCKMRSGSSHASTHHHACSLVKFKGHSLRSYEKFWHSRRQALGVAILFDANLFIYFVWKNLTKIFMLVSAWYVVRRPDLNYETSLVYEKFWQHGCSSCKNVGLSGCCDVVRRHYYFSFFMFYKTLDVWKKVIFIV